MLSLSLMCYRTHSGPLEKVGHLTILDDDTGTEEHGNYDLVLRPADTTVVLRDRLEGFARSRGPWQLVIAALHQLNA